jgi:hypothetical protein
MELCLYELSLCKITLRVSPLSREVTIQAVQYRKYNLLLPHHFMIYESSLFRLSPRSPSVSASSWFMLQRLFRYIP